jgi:integrase
MRKRCAKNVYEYLTDVERTALEKARAKMRLVRLAHRTQGVYLHRIAGYMVFIRTRLWGGLSRRERIEAYLSDFARRRRSASTQNQAFNAIKFFFERVYGIEMGEIDGLRARVSKRIRVPPAREDTVRMLGAVENTVHCHYRTLGFIIYGLGLRVSEVIRLRRKDVLLRHGKIVVRQGKGDKDRVLTMPCNLMGAIERQMAICDRVWEVDARDGVGVALPDSLALKYPANPLKRDWAWLFPSASRCEWEVRPMRHHVSAQAVRVALGDACQRAGIERITPHYLRHGFASDFQGDLQLLQQVMGHKQIETTMGYRHLRTMEHMSPIDGLAVG